MFKRLSTCLLFVIGAIPLIAQAPNGYYDTANGLAGSPLKNALHNIIDDHIEYPYTSSGTDVWDILKETDRDPNNANNVILFYTGWSVNAAQEYNSAAGWTREHVWAKSRGNFGTSLGAGTDAHHLRPSDVSVNSARNNRWFDEADFEYIDGDGPTGCYTSNTQWIWEPRPEVKGDVARMLFYMAVRYEGGSGEPDLELVDYLPPSNTQDPIHAVLSTLLQWHNSDPVDAFEMNRNEVVFTYQGNRNPFIDNPSWVCDIWGGDCSGAGSGSGSGGVATIENFDNFSGGGSYQSGTFTGQDGSTWTYASSRGDIAITGSAPTLGKNRSPVAEVESGTISGGIATLKFDYMQAFSTPVNLDVYVNNTLVATVNGGAQNVVTSSGDINVNINGDFTLRFVQKNTSSGQVTIDNIEWTDMGSGSGSNNDPVEVLASYFETGWDNWTDGGGDCARYSGSRSAEGSYSIRLRDNSSTASSMTSPALDLSSYQNATLDFDFYAYSMETNEDFFIRYSSNGGSSWTTIETFASGTDFNNNTFYSVSIDLSNYGISLTDDVKFRIQCDASSNADQVYIDAVVVTGIPANSALQSTEGIMAIQTDIEANDGFESDWAEDEMKVQKVEWSLYPNPTVDFINIKTNTISFGEYQIINANGTRVMDGYLGTQTSLDVSQLAKGMYILITKDETGKVFNNKFIKQ